MDILSFIQSFPEQSFKKGHVFLSEGDTTDTIWALRQGFAKVSALQDDGSERLLWIAGRYDIVPTERLFSKSRLMTFSYTAMTDCSAYAIEKSAFLTKATDEPAFMAEIAQTMSIHYDDLMDRVATMEHSTVSLKLVATLQYLAKRFSSGDSVDLYALGLPLTHQDIADLIGATRETTSVELKKLRDKGLVDYGPGTLVVRMEKGV